MAITLSGTGAVTGLAAGGLPAGSVTATNLASGAAKTNYGSISGSDLPSGTVLRAYTAYSGTGVQGAGSTPFDIGLNFSNVVINSGEMPLLFLNVSSRSVTGSGQHHCGLRLRYTGSATGVVGDSTWGFGIVQGAGWSWVMNHVSGLNLKQARGNPFNSTGTFTFYVQAATASDALIFGGEVNGSLTATYGQLHGTILIVKE